MREAKTKFTTNRSLVKEILMGVFGPQRKVLLDGMLKKTKEMKSKISGKYIDF